MELFQKVNLTRYIRDSSPLALSLSPCFTCLLPFANVDMQGSQKSTNASRLQKWPVPCPYDGGFTEDFTFPSGPLWLAFHCAFTSEASPFSCMSRIKAVLREQGMTDRDSPSTKAMLIDSLPTLIQLSKIGPHDTGRELHFVTLPCIPPEVDPAVDLSVQYDVETPEGTTKTVGWGIRAVLSYDKAAGQSTLKLARIPDLDDPSAVTEGTAPEAGPAREGFEGLGGSLGDQAEWTTMKAILSSISKEDTKRNPTEQRPGVGVMQDEQPGGGLKPTGFP